MLYAECSFAAYISAKKYSPCAPNDQTSAYIDREQALVIIGALSGLYRGIYNAITRGNVVSNEGPIE